MDDAAYSAGLSKPANVSPNDIESICTLKRWPDPLPYIIKYFFSRDNQTQVTDAYNKCPWLKQNKLSLRAHGVHLTYIKTFRRRARYLLNELQTFDVPPVFKWKCPVKFSFNKYQFCLLNGTYLGKLLLSAKLLSLRKCL